MEHKVGTIYKVPSKDILIKYLHSSWDLARLGKGYTYLMYNSAEWDNPDIKNRTIRYIELRVFLPSETAARPITNAYYCWFHKDILNHLVPLDGSNNRLESYIKRSSPTTAPKIVTD